MKPISSIQLSETLNLSECRDGFWLYDTTRGMNLAMRAKTKDAAFLEALDYYQERLSQVEREYADLSAKINAFVEQFASDED